MTVMSGWALTALIASVLVGAALAEGPAATDPKPPQSQDSKIRVSNAGAFGGDTEMLAKVFVPDGAGPFPVVVFSHGRPGDGVDRQNLTEPIPLGHVRFWQREVYAVVAPIRPGYGETGGTDGERSGASYDAFGVCRAQPDFETPAKNAVRAVLAAIEWVRAQPWAAKDRILLVGTSMGGVATVATAATNPPGVIAYINFAGGEGGSPQRSPGKSCGVAQMESLMAKFGQSTKVPNLWLYAANDLYWGADAPKVWHAAFAAGGSPTRFVQTSPVPNHDGHLLMRYGGALWTGYVEEFVKTLGP